MCAATCLLPDMGEWTITSQIRIDGQIAPDFSYDWEVLFQGHKYIQPLRKPQGSKDNEQFASVINLTFQHWAIWQLKRWPFVTMQPIDSGTAVADEEVADVSLNLKDFCDLFKQVLAYYYGDKITLSLNPEWQYKEEAEVISISHTKVWNVLVQVFYEKFGVRWDIKPNGSPDKYVIRIGYPTTEQSHIFEYGFEGGLMKVERQTQSEEITNMLKGRGGEKNLPFRYFKNTDTTNPDFAPDPDWIEELANIYFSRLMPATFRSYVQGWKAAHISKYPGYTAKGEVNAYSPWAYRKGFTDEKFHPVEFVADEIVLPGAEAPAHRQIEILPGYSPFVKKGSSLDKYGPLLNSLDDNDEIFPTIQGVTVNPYGRIDQTVAVEPITSDDIADSAESDAKVSTFESPFPKKTETVTKYSRKTIVLTGDWFSVPTGKTANFNEGDKSVILTKNEKTIRYDFNTGYWYISNEEVAVGYEKVIIEETSVVLESMTGSIVSASGIPSGTYRYKVTCKVYNTATEDYNVTVSLENPKLTDATLDDKWRNVWHIWVKNIWQTSKQLNESDKEYAERVWRPILGDREENKAKVLFTSGALAISEDYEFTIVSTPEYDTSKTLDGVQSHWKITLAKSDADLESLGVYLPSTMRQAIAGDYFVFLGIDPQHYYTDWAERRLDDWKKDNLRDKSDIKPTWVVQTDRVRLNGYGKEDALIRQLHPGDTLRLADKRFIEGDYETLYLSSLTYTYREPTSEDAALNPDVEIVLSDRYEVSANIVSTLQGEVSALAKQVGSISNIEQIVRMVGDKLYLRKDGLPDRSLSPTEFASLLTSMGFRSGMVGGAGWGIYKDANGNWVIEADRFMARQDLEVNNLIINQVEGQGGTKVDCAAFMEITRVEELDNGYKCYFDQHEGTVANLFHVDDVAWNNRYTPDNDPLKFYRRRVTEVGADYVVLTKPLNGSARPLGWTDSGVNGKGIPAEGDVIVHRGNYTDKERQYIKVRDVVGGGYERYIEGLDSVNAEGVEYYFVGRQSGQNPRLLIGRKDGEYAEWKDGKLNIKGSLSVQSTIGDKTLDEYFKGLLPEDKPSYVEDALRQYSEIDGGLFITSFISAGYTDNNGLRHNLAGMNGIRKTDKSPFLWGGGNMVDRFFNPDGTPRTTDPADYAKAIVRMDGTGYFCGGNIRLEKDYALFGSEELGIKIGTDGAFRVGSGVRFDVTNVEGLNTALGELANFNVGLSNMLRPIGKDGKEKTWIYAATNPDDIESIKVLRGLWTDQYLAARGDNPNGSASSGASELRMLDDVLIGNNLAAGQSLVYNGTKWVNQAIQQGLNTSELANYLSTNKYATQSWVEGRGYALSSDLTAHMGNTTVHITADERTLWNNTASNLSAILGADSDTVINKWEEVVAFLDTYTEADTLANLLSNKLGKTEAESLYLGINSNAASASKLSGNAAFKAWGQTFFENGRPKDISGDMTGVGSIKMSDILYLKNPSTTNGFYLSPQSNGGLAISAHTDYGWQRTVMYMTHDGNVGVGYTPAYKLDVNGVIRANGEVIATSGNAFRVVQGNYGAFFRMDGNNFYLLFTDKNDQYGTWNSLRPLYIDNATGLVKMQNGLNVNSVTIGDCEITWDASAGMLKFSKGIYSLGSVAARGANDSVGGSSGGGSSFGLMRTWDTAQNDKNTDDALGANLGWELKNALAKCVSLTSAGVAEMGRYIDFHSANFGTNAAEDFTVRLDAGAASTSRVFTFPTSGGTLATESFVSGGYLPTAQVSQEQNTDPYTWIRAYAKNNRRAHVHNTLGIEWQYLIGIASSGNYGSVVRASYNNGTPTMQVMGLYSGTWSDWVTMLSSANYSNYALPLSGGTLTGALKVDSIQNQAGNVGMLGYKQPGQTNWFVGAVDTQGIIRSNDTSLLHKRNGVDYIIWDSYNDGSGSGMDADLLDGVHYANILERNHSMTFSQKASDGVAHWYRVGVTLRTNSESPQAIVFIGRNYWSPQNEGYVFSISVGYNGNINISQLSGVAGVPIIDKIRIVWSNGAAAYLDIHVKYPGNTSYTNALHVTSVGAIRTYASTEVVTDPSTSGLNVYEYSTHAGMGCSTGFNGNASSATVATYLKAVCDETTDLNSLVSDNFMHYYGGGAASNANKPDSGQYGLLNLRSADGHRTQLIVQNNVWRSRYYNGSSWSGWSRLAYTTDNVASATNADKLDGLHSYDFMRSVYVGGTNANANDYITGGSYRLGASPVNIPSAGGAYGNLLVVRGTTADTLSQIYFKYTENRAWLRSGVTNTVADTYYANMTWREFAFMDSNVASASRLATTSTYSAWGRSFFYDGVPHSISGDMTGVGSIKGTDAVAPYLLQSVTPTNAGNLGSAPGFGLAPGNYGTFIWGTGDGKGHIQVGRKDGTATAYNLILQEFGGNVGIGTTAPAYKLDVLGSQRLSSSISGSGSDVSLELWRGTNASWKLLNQSGSLKIQNNYTDKAGDYFSCMTLVYNSGNVGFGTETPSYKVDAVGSIRAQNGWLRNSGAYGWVNETYGGGWYMSDSTWIRVYNGKSVYQASGILRTDGQLHVGGNGSVFYVDRATGKVGVGTPSPEYGLDVNKYMAVRYEFYGLGSEYGNYALYHGLAEGEAMRINALDKDGKWKSQGITLYTNGNVKVGGTVSDYKFNVGGVIYSSVGIFSDGYVAARGDNSSDIRLKEDIRDFNATDIIRRLQPKQFKWNAMARSRFAVFDTDEVQYGLIAQETDKVAPWLVDHNMFGDGLWGVKYGKLIPVILQAQKEVTFTVDDLLVRVRKLESSNERLERENEELRAELKLLRGNK